MGRTPLVEPEVIRDLATAGFTASRMSTMLGIRIETIKGIARRYHVALPTLSPEERSAITIEAQRRRRAKERSAAEAPIEPAVAGSSDCPANDPELDDATRALIATGGRYAALATYAADQGITTAQALSRWHRLGLRLGAKGVR